MTAPEERAGCEHAGPGYWGWWCRDCHSISVSQARAKFAQEDMLDQLATHARRLESAEAALKERDRMADEAIAYWRQRWEQAERRLEEARAALKHARYKSMMIALSTVEAGEEREFIEWVQQEAKHIEKECAVAALLAHLSPPPPYNLPH